MEKNKRIFESIQNAIESEKAQENIVFNAKSFHFPKLAREVEFIRYTGEYPSACSGELTVKIDGLTVKFESGCLRSGGCVWFDDSYSEHIESAPWYLLFNGISKELKIQIENVVNNNVPFGCCGGCV